MKKNKAITSDLFEIESCQFCNGEGEVEVENKANPNEERTEDCDMCNGNGVSQ
jgi:DnaJ-class molecular chaperone